MKKVLLPIVVVFLVVCSNVNAHTIPQDEILFEVDEKNRSYDEVELWLDTNPSSPTSGNSIIIRSVEVDPEIQYSSGGPEKKYQVIYKTRNDEFILYEEDFSEVTMRAMLRKVVIPESRSSVIIEYKNDYLDRRMINTENLMSIIQLKPEKVVRGWTIWLGNRSTNGFYGSNYFSYSVIYKYRDREYVYISKPGKEMMYRIDEKGFENPSDSENVYEFKPFFRCDERNSIIERVICRDSALSALDNTLNTLYQKVSSTNDILSSQRHWLRERSQCGRLPREMIKACVAEKYEHRIRELLNLDSQNN